MMLFWLLNSIVIIVLGLGGVAFVTLLERKLLGLSQIRIGPNKVSFFGLLQPMADGVKLLWKEEFFILKSHSLLFLLSPLLFLIMFLLFWTWIVPWDSDLLTSKYSSLIFFFLLGLSAYSVIFTGWSSLSSFSKMGSMRGMLQSLSIEVVLVLVFLIVLLLNKGFFMKSDKNMSEELMLIWGLTWFILSLMETNRAPFDLLEGESELISGFNLEMGSVSFVFLFLGEYGMIMVLMLMMTIPFSGYVSLVSMLFVSLVLITRSCFPRVRYDILMLITWTSLLPCWILSFLLFLFLYSLGLPDVTMSKLVYFMFY